MSRFDGMNAKQVGDLMAHGTVEIAEVASLYKRAIELLWGSGERDTQEEKDAARYRWLRAQQWNDADMFVVIGSKSKVRLGTDCPCLERLDDAIDAARSTSLDKTSPPSQPEEYLPVDKTLRTAK